MMRRQNPVQLEIFPSSNSNLNESEKRPNQFLSRIWNYEKTILIIITVLIVSLVSFSLGFERGKKSSLRAKPLPNVVAQSSNIKEEKKASAITVDDDATKDKKDGITEGTLEIALVSNKLTAPNQIQANQKNYTIQVATYKSKSFAQKEAERLKNRGFQPLIVSKGTYTELCVGKFLSQSEAKNFIKELKKRYGDCFVRRL